MVAPQNAQVPSLPNQPIEPGTQRRLSVRKKILFSIIVPVVLFTALELFLALIGVRPLTFREDPFVGFTSRSRLFQEAKSPDAHSHFRTSPKKLQWFNPQEFPATKDKNTYRIFCVGGSTTYGRPYDDTTSFCGWLRESLPAVDTKHQWEVINAGGISYASYRVAMLMEELIDYEPDLFIIYCGHNEFLEQRTYRSIIATPRAVRETMGILAQTRIYAFVSAMLPGGGAGNPNDRSEADKLPEEVDTILDGSVGPDDYERDNDQQFRTIDHYRFNLRRMVEIAQSVGAQVLFVTPAGNESGMSPFKSQHKRDLVPDELARWNQLIALADTQREMSKPELALRSIDQAIEIDPFYAHTHFDRGTVLSGLNRYPEAKQAFQRAIDEDVCPLRILSEMRLVISEVALQLDIPVVNFQELIESNTQTGITGNEWFLDHVHPTIEGNRELAFALLHELQVQGIVVPNRQWTEETRRQVEATVLGRIDERDHGVALRNLAKVLSWARKYEEAGRLAQLASARLPDDAEAHCMAGYNFERRGQLDSAQTSYEAALKLQPNYAHAHYNLGHVHRKRQEWESAAQSFQKAIDADPRYPGAHYNLGRLLQKANRLELAAQCFKTSNTINPKHPGSWEELGTVRLQQGNTDAAIQHLKRAIQLDPNVASAHNTLGVAFAQLGQLQKAVEHFERAVEISPQFKEAQQNMERARKLIE